VLSFFLMGAAEAEQATGCLSSNGQLSRLAVGTSPVGGQCPGNQTEVELALASDDSLRFDVAGELGEPLHLGQLGDFDLEAGCGQIDATRLDLRIEIRNFTDQPLTLIIGGPVGIEARGGHVLYHEVFGLSEQMLRVTGQSGVQAAFAVAETGDVYDLRSVSVSFGDGTCSFSGQSTLFRAADRPL
jgi:hypothetical protein